MTQIEISKEIIRLQKQLNNYKAKLKNAKSEQKQVDDLVNQLRRKKREMEDGLQETVNTVKRKIERIKSKNHFGSAYLNEVEKILYSSNSSSALESIKESERKAIQKFNSLDTDIENYKKKISLIEQEIFSLKQRIN